jgi:hypothetical protein
VESIGINRFDCLNPVSPSQGPASNSNPSLGIILHPKLSLPSCDLSMSAAPSYQWAIHTKEHHIGRSLNVFIREQSQLAPDNT